MKNIRQVKTVKELVEWGQEKRSKIINELVINIEVCHNQLSEMEDTFNKKMGELKNG